LHFITWKRDRRMLLLKTGVVFFPLYMSTCI
jgi:hypothetical protein